MTSLDELFPDGPRESDQPSFVLDDRHTVRRLSEMIGAPRERSAAVSTASSVEELSRMVERAGRGDGQQAPVAERAPVKRRRGRHIDRLAVGIAGLSVIALAAALTVGGVQMATASPVSGALKSLQQDEATLQNAYQRLVAARDRVSESLAAGIAEAQQMRTALDATAVAPDPAADEEGAMLEIVEPSALAAMRAAADAYATGLAEIDDPELPEEYARGAIDEDSLAEVGDAINRAQEHLAAVDKADAEISELRAEVDALEEGYDQALGAFAGTFTATAAAALEEYPDADEQSRAAVSDAAARIVASGAAGAEGLAALTAYRDAIVAAAEDQLQADIERREREEEEERRRRTQQPDPDPTVTPVEPTPDPTVPPEEPTDPEQPTDPIVP